MFLPKWSLAPWVSVDFPRLIKALSGRELQEILLEAHVPRDALGKSVRSVGKKPMEHVFFSDGTAWNMENWNRIFRSPGW